MSPCGAYCATATGTVPQRRSVTTTHAPGHGSSLTHGIEHLFETSEAGVRRSVSCQPLRQPAATLAGCRDCPVAAGSLVKGRSPRWAPLEFFESAVVVARAAVSMMQRHRSG